MRVMFEEESDPTESVDVLYHSEIHRVVAYIRMYMHDRVAAQKQLAEAISPYWWDDRELVTVKFGTDVLVARVTDNMADQYDGSIGSNPPTWSAPRVRDRFDEMWPNTFGDYRRNQGPRR